MAKLCSLVSCVSNVSSLLVFVSSLDQPVSSAAFRQESLKTEGLGFASLCCEGCCEHARPLVGGVVMHHRSR